MQTRTLGNSQLKISTLGLGSWAIGGDIGDWGWGTQSTRESIKVIHAALDQGINWIDTAPAYGLGNAEKVIAKALHQTHYTPFIFTKCGFRWNDGESELQPCLTKQSILQEVEHSLRRLNIDCIDLYQIHTPNPSTQLEEAWQTLAELQQTGKVRHIGVSNFSQSQLQRIQEIAPITSLQPPYSLLNRRIEHDVLPWCTDNNIGVIHHSAMSHGLLTGDWNIERLNKLNKRDWRHKSNQFQQPEFNRIVEAVNKLKGLADSKQCQTAQLSLAWTLANQATTGTIIGARTEKQLNQLLPATEIGITHEEMTIIEQLFPK